MFYTVYLIFLWTFTQIQGESPYPVFTFDSAIAWIMAFVLLPAVLVSYLTMFGLTFLKFRCVKDVGKACTENDGAELKDLDSSLPTHDVSLNTIASPVKIEKTNNSRLIGCDSQI